MILSKSTLKLLLFSILTLAIISCGGETKAKTTSVKVSIDVPNSISRGVKGTYPDITDIILDISDANGKYYAKGRQFQRVTDGVDFVWTTTVDNVPVNRDLNFTASAYDINETKIFKGLTGKTLTLQSAAVFINLFPISDGNAPSIPEITSVSPVSDGVLLHIEDDVSDKVQYQVSPDNFKNSTGTVTIDASGKGTIHLINKDGLFSNIPIYNITLNNHIGGVLETTFAYRQSSDANITIGIAPTVNGIKFKKIGDDKLQVELDVSDDKDISDLSYSWSFNGNSDINIENNAINPIIINNFNDSIEGTLITIVTDKHNLTYTHEYNITANQFKADIEFKVSSTSVDDNKIFVNESIDILFNKEIRVDEINTNSININDGVKSVPGSFTFPSTNKKKVVFTPSAPWKTTKNYNLNITAKVLDTNGHKLIPVVIEFTAQTPVDKRSCKAILDSNPSSSDGTYSIDPDGAGGDEAFDVYCDMSTDGGGWILMRYGAYTTKINLILPSGAISGALSDSKIESIKLASSQTFRVSNASKSLNLYIKDTDYIPRPHFNDNYDGGASYPHVWSSNGSVSCATNYLDVLNNQWKSTIKAVSCSATAIGSHTCGTGNGWILLHAGGSYNISNTNPCVVQPGGSGDLEYYYIR